MRVLAASRGSTADHMMVPAKPPQPMAEAESLINSHRLGLGLSTAVFPGNVRRRICNGTWDAFAAVAAKTRLAHLARFAKSSSAKLQSWLEGRSASSKVQNTRLLYSLVAAASMQEGKAPEQQQSAGQNRCHCSLLAVAVRKDWQEPTSIPHQTKLSVHSSCRKLLLGPLKQQHHLMQHWHHKCESVVMRRSRA